MSLPNSMYKHGIYMHVVGDCTCMWLDAESVEIRDFSKSRISIGQAASNLYFRLRLI